LPINHLACTFVRHAALLAVLVLVLVSVEGAGAQRDNDAVPILMYHVIAPAPSRTRYPELYVDPATFDRQVAWLAAHGFHAVTLRAVYDHWRRGRTLPPRPIVFTFDDGYRSQYANARPTLRAHGWPAVLNLAVRNEDDRWGMPPELVRKLIRAGWEIDAHSINHPDLTALSTGRLRQEVSGSRASIRRQFHVPADFFCYPAGRYNAAVVAAVRRAGYLGAASTEHGLARPTDLYALDRIRVNRSDGTRGLVAKLRALGVT
jgi:peptidoglycan/xylan/chitin deacetylase (PgdA/CDA1 family)